KQMIYIFFIIGIMIPSTTIHAEEVHDIQLHEKRSTSISLTDLDKRFTYDSGLDFEYPDAVRGIFVTGPSAGGSKFDDLIELVDSTELNAMVIDIKEDFGNLTFKPEEGSAYEQFSDGFITDPRKMLKKLEEKGIYPIARIVV